MNLSNVKDNKIEAEIRRRLEVYDVITKFNLEITKGLELLASKPRTPDRFAEAERARAALEQLRDLYEPHW
jgi:hypothetical protein